MSPMIGIITKEAAPRGNMASPASNDEYPRRVCIRSGIRTVLPYRMKPRTVIRKTPEA